jgi:hypothetical protein
MSKNYKMNSMQDTKDSLDNMTIAELVLWTI